MQVPYLERYEILQTLGQGGMGVVYLARQKKLDRLVAIKAISPYLAQEPEIRERFASEASVLARLSHPNIVTLYDYIEEPDSLYLVMEYVEGKPLSEILKAGPLPLESVRKYFYQVLDAFTYAHSKGVIHRDIKPSNIIITPEGQVKILDFGVAKILSADHSQTRTGMRLGTLMYMSPEQVKGEKNIDARSDIYSLGVVLFEMLTGRPPYDPDLGEFEMSLRIVREPLFDLSHPPAQIPQKILETILHATEKNPDHRFSSCKEFKEALEKAFQEQAPSLTPPTEMAKVPLAPDRNKRKLWYGLGVGVILILIIGVVLSIFWRNGGFARSKTLATDTTKVDTPQSLPDTATLATLMETRQTDALTSSQAIIDTAPEKPSRKPSTGSEQAPQSSTVKPKMPPTQKKETGPSPAPSAPDTSFKAQSTTPSMPFHRALKTEVKNFKKYGLLQVKADLVLTNNSPHTWKNIQITLRLLNKEGKVKKTDVVYVGEIAPHGVWEKKLDYLVGGTASIESEVTAAEAGP